MVIRIRIQLNVKCKRLNVKSVRNEINEMDETTSQAFLSLSLRACQRQAWKPKAWVSEANEHSHRKGVVILLFLQLTNYDLRLTICRFPLLSSYFSLPSSSGCLECIDRVNASLSVVITINALRLTPYDLSLPTSQFLLLTSQFIWEYGVHPPCECVVVCCYYASQIVSALLFGGKRLAVGGQRA